jgi:chorismate mutase
MQFKTANPGKAIREAGVDGVLVTDLIPEEANDFVSSMRESGVDTIFLVAPTSTEARMRLIAEHSSGFIYVLARAGVTGIREHLSSELRDLVGSVRRHTRLPIAVGFGISRREHVSEVWEYADAAVVGSRLVLEIERHLNSANLVTEVGRLARELIGDYESGSTNAGVEDWRRRIDEIDLQLVQLFNERSQCAIEIGHVKHSMGLEVYSPSREAEVDCQRDQGKQRPARARGNATAL